MSIIGELDAYGALEVDKTIEKMLQKAHYNICIDCQELQYISSAGLGVFISYFELFQEKKGHLIFYNLNDKVKNVFQLLGLEKIMKITKNLEEAQMAINES